MTDGPADHRMNLKGTSRNGSYHFGKNRLNRWIARSPAPLLPSSPHGAAATGGDPPPRISALTPACGPRLRPHTACFQFPAMNSSCPNLRAAPPVFQDHPPHPLKGTAPDRLSSLSHTGHFLSLSPGMLSPPSCDLTLEVDGVICSEPILFLHPLFSGKSASWSFFKTG